MLPTLMLALLVALIAMLLFALLQLHRRVEALHARLGDAALPPPAAEAGRPVIGIAILNAFELAEREHVLAGHAARIAPRMIERIVYQRAAVQIAEQLKLQGVQATVTAHVD